MTTWKDIVVYIARHGASTPSQVAEDLGCSREHARVLLERCRQFKTLRYAGRDGRARLYEITSYGARRMRAGFRKLGEWEVMG